MKKGFRLLAVLSATVFMISGCGTSLYEMTDDEENLVVQYAAYAVGKHNIHQKDGMTNAVAKEQDSQVKEEQSTQKEQDTQSNQNSANQGSAGQTGDSTGTDTSNYAQISLEKALGYDSALNITYKGYKVQDSYKEGNYFAVNAASGNKLLVMNFTISNPGKKTVKYDTTSLGNSFYGVFDGKTKIAEKMTFSNKELSSGTNKIKAGKKIKAIMIFELTADQAAAVTTETLLVDIDNTTYQVKL